MRPIISPRLVLPLLCTLCILGSASSASAQGQSKASSAQGGELYSIEKRDLMGSHELHASVGVLPMDAFGKGMTLQGTYTYHFTHLHAWEIGGMYAFNFGTGLEQELKDRFLVQATEVGQLQWVLNTNYVIKPLYGKFALTNDKLLSAEMFFAAGYSLGGYTAATVPYGVNFGTGIRMFLGRYFSLRLDIRDYMFFPEFKSLSNNLHVALGLCITFGFADEKEKED